MVANVAVDDEIVVNDFDNVPFFNRRICCGHLMKKVTSMFTLTEVSQDLNGTALLVK